MVWSAPAGRVDVETEAEQQTRYNHRASQALSNGHYTRSHKWQIKLFLLCFCRAAVIETSGSV